MCYGNLPTAHGTIVEYICLCPGCGNGDIDYDISSKDVKFREPISLGSGTQK